MDRERAGEAVAGGGVGRVMLAFGHGLCPDGEAVAGGGMGRVMLGLDMGSCPDWMITFSMH